MKVYKAQQVPVGYCLPELIFLSRCICGEGYVCVTGKEGEIQQFWSEHQAFFKLNESGQPGWFSDLAPPSAQGVILDTRD